MIKKNSAILRITLLLPFLFFQMNTTVLAQNDDESYTEAVNQSGLPSNKKEYLLNESREHFLNYISQLRENQPEGTINVRELIEEFINFFAIYPHPNRAPGLTVGDFLAQRNTPPTPLVVVNQEELLGLQRALTERQNTIAFLSQQIASTQYNDQSIIDGLNYDLDEERRRAEILQSSIEQLEELRRIESENEERKKAKEEKEKEKRIEAAKKRAKKREEERKKEIEKLTKKLEEKDKELLLTAAQATNEAKKSETIIVRLRQELQQQNTEQPTHTPAQQSEQRAMPESSEDLTSQQSSETSEDNNDSTIKPTTCESEPDKCQKQSEHNHQRVNKKKSKRKENSDTTSKPVEKVLPNAVKAIAATQLKASGEGRDDSQSSNYWQTLKSTAASLSSRGIKATRRIASRVYDAAGSLYDKSRRGMKAVIKKLNPAKRHTGRLVRKRPVRAGYSPLKALTYTAVSLGALFWGVKSYRYRVTETDKELTAKKQTSKEFLLKAIKRLNTDNNLLVGQLIQEFIDSPWEKADFPVTGIYDKSSGTILTKMEQPTKTACSDYEYGIVGYTDQAISQNHIPFFSVSDDKFTTIIINTITYLANKAPDLMVPGNNQHIDTLASSLMWCGLPTGNKSKKLHRCCLDAVIQKMKNEGVDWYNHGIHKHYWHGIDSSEQSESMLTVSPVFNLTTECELGILSYQPRVVKPSFISTLYVNTPLIDHNYSSTQIPPTENHMFSAPPEDYSHTGMKKTKPIPDRNKEQSLQELTMLSNLHETAILQTPDSSLAERFHYLPIQQGTKLDKHAFMWKLHPLIDHHGLRKKNISYFPYYLSIIDRTACILYLILYKSNSFFIHSPFILYLATRTYIYFFHPDIQNHYVDEKSDTNMRISFLQQTLNQYKANLKDNKKYNMLFLLSLDTNSPLGVISFNDNDVEYYFDHIKKIKTFGYYPLSQLENGKQKILFDKAFFECSRRYGIECNHENQIHREYIKFYLAICSDKHSCTKSLFDNTYSFWIMISNEFDWPEIETYQFYYKSPTFKFDQHDFYLVVFLNEKNNIVNLGVEEKTSSLNEVKSYFSSINSHQKESSLVSINGKYFCYPFVPENSNTCLFSTTKKQTLLTNFNKEKIFLLQKFMYDQSSILLFFLHDTLLHTHTNKKMSFAKNTNIKEASCSNIIYNNLRAYCSTVANSIKKRDLSLIMEVKAEKNLWIPVFKKSTSNESSEYKYHFSHRIKFSELSIDQVGRHIDYILTYMEQGDISTKSLLHSNILINSLSVIGVLDDESDSIHQDVYDARYQSVLGRSAHNKELKKLIPCLNTKIQVNRLCSDKDECLRLMPGWRIKVGINNQVSHYIETLYPVWIAHDNTRSAFLNASAVSQAPQFLGNTNKLKVYKYTSQLNKPEESVSGESIESNSETLYVLSENELQYSRKLDVYLLKDGMIHTDHCGIGNN